MLHHLTKASVMLAIGCLAAYSPAGAASASPAGPASPADEGVGISASPIVLDQDAHPGHTYTVGPVAVVNTGTEPGTVRLRVDDEPGHHGPAVPAGWVRFERNRVPLDPGEQAGVGIQVTVPDDADPGDYQSLVYAGLEGPDAAAGASRVGVEAATRLTFTVTAAPASGGIGWLVPLLAGGGVLGTLGLVVAGRAHRRRRHFALDPSHH